MDGLHLDRFWGTQKGGGHMSSWEKSGQQAHMFSFDFYAGDKNHMRGAICGGANEERTHVSS